MTRRCARPAVLAAALAAMAYVATVVFPHTIAIVRARHLLPRWDLAAHLGHGWLDYHYLVTGQIHRLIWDLWLQGYWPPIPSLFQLPFYLLMGGDMTSGLTSSLAAFVLVGVTGAAILWRQWGAASLLPSSVFLALLVSSPFLLAYASVTMTETIGALAQLLVVYASLRYCQERSPSSARLFAISLTALFFTKYNYFLLLAGPLVIHEWLTHTAGDSPGRRLAAIGRLARRILTSPAGALVGVYAVVLALIFATGGIEFRLLGQRVSVRGIGSSGHVVLYVLLARLWYLHRKGRIDWTRIVAADPRVRPLLVWFVLPVTLWMASPYPNHIQDFANLVINRPMGDDTLGAGLSTYITALRTTYFYREWLMLAVVGVFAAAAVRYRRHAAPMQFLILTIPIQLGIIAVHQTRFPRFLHLTVVLLCLVAASEVGRWCASSDWRRRAGMLLAPVALATGLVAANRVVTEERFRSVAFELYADSEPLRSALAAIRTGLTVSDRLAVVGQNNDLSPALFRWELGPPSGTPCFPFELAGARKLDLAHATRVLLIEPDGPDSPLDAVSYYMTQRDAVRARVDRGEFVLRREFPVPDLRVIMKLYARTSPPPHEPRCR